MTNYFSGKGLPSKLKGKIDIAAQFKLFCQRFLTKPFNFRSGDVSPTESLHSLIDLENLTNLSIDLPDMYVY